MTIIFIAGGARSGKSRKGEELAISLADASCLTPVPRSFGHHESRICKSCRQSLFYEVWHCPGT